MLPESEKVDRTPPSGLRRARTYGVALNDDDVADTGLCRVEGDARTHDPTPDDREMHVNYLTQRLLNFVPVRTMAYRQIFRPPLLLVLNKR
jgi:hypothetical protein